MQAARGTPLTTNDGDATEPVERAQESESNGRHVRLFVVVCVLAYVTDVVTKAIAVDTLRGRTPVDAIPGFLSFTYTTNAGAAFGLATGLTIGLSLVAVVVVIVVIKMATRLRDPVWAVALGLLLAGAMGNLTDRIFRDPGVLRGHVVDFLELPNWPVFNVADMCITTAAALVVIQSLRGIGPEGRREPAATS
ncbi:MAG TPA: signal peptidase II [Nocardioidaceae bacterium]|nr:signal peptidase II [Nocardioidaceae bacterium]